MKTVRHGKTYIRMIGTSKIMRNDHGTHPKGLIILPGVYNQTNLTRITLVLPGILEEILCRPQ